MRRIVALLFLCAGCLEPYSPPTSSGNLNALVVDGFIDANGSASVILTRSIPLDGLMNIPKESGAVVTVESSGGETFSLHEDATGSYSAKGLAVDKTSTYTLHITTSNGDAYASDAMKIYSTPPIDSVYFTIDPFKGLEIRVDSHSDDPDSPGYYLLNGVETYEYHAAVYAHWKLVNHVAVERLPEEYLYVCYKDERTKNVLASTKGLKANRVTGARLSIIERTSPKISYKYSILVRQRAISEEEYTYQRLLLTTTEQQASLFAQIPGAVIGNIHSTSNPGEYVLGYFSAQEVKELRYFIKPLLQLPEGFFIKTFMPNCQPEATCGAGGAGGCIDGSAISDQAGIVGVVFDTSNNPIGFTWVYGECADCTMKGGTTKVPSFW
jgi:hypothetical protein